MEYGLLKGILIGRGSLVGNVRGRGQLSGSVHPQCVLTGAISSQGQLTGQVYGRGSLSAAISARGVLVGTLTVGGGVDYDTYMLVYEDGTEVPAVYVDDEVTFTATANDIRIDTVAATATGVTVGTKVIPSYHTTEGYTFISSGNEFAIFMFDDSCDFTKLQCIICPFSGDVVTSVFADKVVIDNHTYSVQSSTVLGNVTVDSTTNTIKLGVVNNSDTIYMIRYFTYKEEY